MDKKKLFIIALVVVVVIILLGVGGYFLINREGSQENPIKKLNDINLNDQPGGSLLPPARDEEQKNEEEKELSDFDKREVVAKNRAKFFVEMLGSYSPESGFLNITELRGMMTYRMKVWADDFIERNSGKDSQERITTQAFKLETLNSSGSNINILVYTRRERVDQGKTTLYNQNALVSMTRAQDEWLVDSIEWK